MLGIGLVEAAQFGQIGAGANKAAVEQKPSRENDALGKRIHEMGDAGFAELLLCAKIGSSFGCCITQQA